MRGTIFLFKGEGVGLSEKIDVSALFQQVSLQLAGRSQCQPSGCVSTNMKTHDCKQPYAAIGLSHNDWFGIPMPKLCSMLSWGGAESTEKVLTERVASEQQANPQI